jgi:hypothetical protein
LWSHCHKLLTAAVPNYHDSLIFPPSGYKIGIKNLLKPEVRDFWEKLGSHVATEEEGGHVDLFVPLGASGQFYTRYRQAVATLFCESVKCPHAK